MIPILILAAGQSTRMRGSDKLLGEVAGEPLLRRVVRQAQAVSSDVFIALPPDAAGRRAAVNDLGATLLYLPDTAEGMSGTLRGGVAALPPCPAFMILLADMPQITSDDIATVIAAGRTHPDHLIWRGATLDGQPGHPVLFDAQLRRRFADLHGDTGAEPIARALRDKTWLVPLGDRARLDLDTPEDWAAFRAAPPA